MLPRRIMITIFIILILLFLHRCLSKRHALSRAIKLHHSEPPKARSAERAYAQAVSAGYTQAIMPMAQLLHHGLPDGPEPLLPDPLSAADLYLQAALLGDAREQGLARERLRELAPDVLQGIGMVAVNPPQQTRIPDLEPIRVTTEGPKAIVHSDSQNVHDSVLVRHLRTSLENLPSPDKGIDDTINQLESFLSTEDAGSSAERYKALQTVKTMVENTTPVTSIGCTEKDVLAKVWNATLVIADPVETCHRRQMLTQRLAEGHVEGTCTTGRVARTIDALSVFDPRVQLKPTWVLRQEMLDKAAVISRSHKEGDPPLKDVLYRSFMEDYVRPGLMPAYLVKAELDEWGDAI